MSKKTKRQYRSAYPAPTTVAKPAASTNGGSRTYEREFNPDYSNVIKDLRRIGILAGSFFVVLIALSFIL